MGERWLQLSLRPWTLLHFKIFQEIRNFLSTSFASWIASHSQADPMETQFVDLPDSILCQVQHVASQDQLRLGPRERTPVTLAVRMVCHSCGRVHWCAVPSCDVASDFWWVCSRTCVSVCFSLRSNFAACNASRNFRTLGFYTSRVTIAV